MKAACHFLFVSFLLIASASAAESWVELRPARTLQFPHGYRVVEDPRANAKVVKEVAGPTEATIKWTFWNAAGIPFYLSDWSSERRMRGESHFWILANEAGKNPPQKKLTSDDVVYPLSKSISFPNGFEVTSAPSANAAIKSKTVTPATAIAEAHRDVDGVRYYISDWSWDRMQRGIDANWMRPIPGKAMAEPNPKVDPLPGTFDLTRGTFSRVFQYGYEIVAQPTPNSPALQTIREPVLVTVVTDAFGENRHYALTEEQNQRRLAGQRYTWLRDRLSSPDQPEALVRMKELQGQADLYFSTADYTIRPWQFAIDLYMVNPATSLTALEEFGFIPDPETLAYYYEDREFPFGFLREAAGVLEKDGALAKTIELLEDHQPNHDRNLALMQQTDDHEMEPNLTRQNKEFDARMLAIFYAQTGQFAKVESTLSPLLADWKPLEGNLNASGPKINSLREIARAQWMQGKTTAATESTRLWLQVVSRDIATDLLHPDYYDASERVTEFDSDFETIGSYYELLHSVTDPIVAAEIIVGLKGLQSAVNASLKIGKAGAGDSTLAKLGRTNESLARRARDLELEGRPLPFELQQAIFRTHAQLLTHRLSGQGLDLTKDGKWNELSKEIARMGASGAAPYELTPLQQQRDLIAVNELIESGGFFVTPAQISAALHPDEALIDFYRIPASTAVPDGAYGAIVFQSGSPPQKIELASALEIDAAVRSYRSFILGQGDHLQSSLTDLNEKLPEVLKETHDAVFNPLREAVATAKTITICPEGQLCFLPFDLLGPSPDQLLHDAYSISYLNAARDLLRSETVDTSDPREVVLLGNPTFAASGGDAGSETESIDDAQRSALVEVSRGVEFGQLPGTKQEIDSLAPTLTKAGFRVRSLSEEDATEARLRETIRSPYILHLATHGFFLNELPLANQGFKEKSAMLLSGLALTGAQTTLENWNAGIIRPSADDGVLFASEVAELDLSETEIVSLSACETAVGKVQSGEGVEGLRSGLTLAGARNTIITLWPVGDEATVSLMETFYAELIAGSSPSEALSTARRGLFKTMLEQEGPYLAHQLAGPFLLTRSGKLE